MIKKIEKRETVVLSELIEKLTHRRSGLHPNDVKDITFKILEHISEALSKGERIELRGFGSFSLRRRKSRIARNPKTGEKIQLTERSVPYFRPGKILLKSINNNNNLLQPGYNGFQKIEQLDNGENPLSNSVDTTALTQNPETKP